MPLAALADTDDLAARGITVPDTMDADVLLAGASASVRDAAGCAITQLTSTVTLLADDWRELDLPFGPVSAVASVRVDSVEVAGWAKLGDTVTLPPGWTRCLPVEVEVTYTHGYPTVPADIVDLVCGMVAIAAKAGSDDDYGGSGRLQSVRLGDYSETRVMPSGVESPSPVALPDSVRERLRARFGGSAVVLKVR